MTSGAGNGPFGFGWGLSLPSITRKTNKELPQYLDAVDFDVFILSGAEDLMPVYRQDPDGTWVAGRQGFQRDADGFWVRDASGRLVVHEDELDGYRVRRYRPRIDGLFARIERRSKIGSPGDVHWRSISQDNILTLYGHDANSRIVVDAAARDAAQPRQAACMGVEEHLVPLARVGHQPEGPRRAQRVQLAHMTMTTPSSLQSNWNASPQANDSGTYAERPSLRQPRPSSSERTP